MNMDERDGMTLSPRLLRSDRPVLTLAPAGHVSLPEAEFQGMLKELDDLRKFKRQTVSAWAVAPSMNSLIREAARIWSVQPGLITSRRKDRIYSAARYGIFAVGRRLRMDPSEIIAALGMHHQAAQWLARRGAALLDVDPGFRSKVDQLEASCS